MLCCMNEIAAQGKLTFETEEINVGTVSTAEPVAYYYCSFKNTGDKPIGIDKVIISHHRMLAEYSKEMIQPGAQGQIEIRHELQDASTGNFSRVIIIYTSDRTKKRIRISGTISDEIPSKQRRKDNIEWYRTFENGKYGALTINGEIILRPIYSKITNNANGFIAQKDKEWFWLTSKGKLISSIVCDNLQKTPKGFIAQKGTELLLLTPKGELISSIICDELEYESTFEGYLAEKNGIYAFYDHTGKCIVPFSKGYTNIQCNTDKTVGAYFAVRKAGYSALCNRSGQVVYYLAENGNMKPFYQLGRFIVILSNEDRYKIFDYEKNCILTYKSSSDHSLSFSIDEEGNICSATWYEFWEKGNIIGNIKKAVLSKNPFAQ